MSKKFPSYKQADSKDCGPTCLQDSSLPKFNLRA